MKTKFISLFLLAFVFFSCETEDSTTVLLTEADLVGTWNLKEQTLENGSIEYSDSGQTLSATYSAYAKDIDFTMTFSDNPKTVKAEGKYTLVATASFAGQTNTEEELVETVNDPTLNPTWTLNGNNITITDDSDFPANLIVDSYNGTTLRLKASVDETETDGSTTVTIKATVYLVLEK